MDFDEQQRIVQQQRAGFALLRQHEIDQMRKAAIGDRLGGVAVSLMAIPVTDRHNRPLRKVLKIYPAIEDRAKRSVENSRPPSHAANPLPK